MFPHIHTKEVRCTPHARLILSLVGVRDKANNSSDSNICVLPRIVPYFALARRSNRFVSIYIAFIDIRDKLNENGLDFCTIKALLIKAMSDMVTQFEANDRYFWVFCNKGECLIKFARAIKWNLFFGLSHYTAFNIWRNTTERTTTSTKCAPIHGKWDGCCDCVCAGRLCCRVLGFITIALAMTSSYLGGRSS